MPQSEASVVEIVTEWESDFNIASFIPSVSNENIPSTYYRTCTTAKIYVNAGVSSILLGKVNGSFPLGLVTSKMTEAIAVPTPLPPNQECRSVFARRDPRHGK
jgi:hypothetical protein